jgi:hypothetical protein
MGDTLMGWGTPLNNSIDREMAQEQEFRQRLAHLYAEVLSYLGASPFTQKGGQYEFCIFLDLAAMGYILGGTVSFFIKYSVSPI